SVVAYNLTGAFRRQAAACAGVEPRRLSFTGVWTTFQIFLLRHMHTEPEPWREAFTRALQMAMQDKLPNRAGRKFKREAYRKRPKDAQFAKRTKPPSKIKESDLK
ncbi:MAG: IS4 family transposase, partial [Planctomycetota bacterium]